MKYRIPFIIAVIIFTVCIPASAWAHPGKTDSNGGHYDYQNESGLGNYHYHHGYPAHLHVDGECQYGYEDISSYKPIDTHSDVTPVNKEELLKSLEERETSSAPVNFGLITPSSDADPENPPDTDPSRYRKSSEKKHGGWVAFSIAALIAGGIMIKKYLDKKAREMAQAEIDRDYLTYMNRLAARGDEIEKLRKQLKSAQSPAVFPAKNLISASTLLRGTKVYRNAATTPLEKNGSLSRALSGDMHITAVPEVSANIREGDNIYTTTLNDCTCRYYREQQLPCKHMYYLALAIGLIKSEDPSQEAPVKPTPAIDQSWTIPAAASPTGKDLVIDLQDE